MFNIEAFTADEKKDPRVMEEFWDKLKYTSIALVFIVSVWTLVIVFLTWYCMTVFPTFAVPLFIMGAVFIFCLFVGLSMSTEEVLKYKNNHMEVLRRFWTDRFNAMARRFFRTVTTTATATARKTQ